MSEELDRLRIAIETMVELPPKEWEFVEPRLGIRHFEVGTYLFRAGDPVPDFFFVVRGLVRLFFDTEQGKEFNKGFRQEGDFIGVFSFDQATGGSLFYAQTLESTDTVVIPVELLEICGQRHSVWLQINHLQAERVAIEKTKREASLMLESAQARYERFLAESPELVARLPQYHIASYLGITDVALSRIRRKMRDS